MLSRHGIHVRSRLLHRYARPQPRHHVHAHADGAIAKRGIVPLPDRHIYLAISENFEVVANDADNRVVRSVQQNRFPQHIRRTAEFPLPETFSQHDHGRSAGPVFISVEKPPHHRIFAKHLEKICGHLAHGHSLSFAHSRQAVVIAAIGSHRLGGAVLFLPILKAEIGNRALIEAEHFAIHRDEPGRLRIRQRIQHHAVHYAENCSVRANSKRQREHRDDREAWIFRQHPDRVSNVLQQRSHFSNFPD